LFNYDLIIIFTPMAITKFRLLFLLLLTVFVTFFNQKMFAQAATPSDLICGKWLIAEKDLIVQVYKDGSEFKAKIVWFNDSDDKSRPMETRLDADNPDPKLRSQKILGSSVLSNLVYKTQSNSWENGMIYDAKHGRYWDSSAYINKKGELKVTGFWHFKFIGKTLTFTRI
jgi:uncharacterized protein (DUF2147 family)